MENKYVIGLDYGTDSARALIVNASDGKILASSVKYYPRWMKGLYCNPKTNQWRQHPKDYEEVLHFILNKVLEGCSCREDIAAIGIDAGGNVDSHGLQQLTGGFLLQHGVKK